MRSTAALLTGASIAWAVGCGGKTSTPSEAAGDSGADTAAATDSPITTTDDASALGNDATASNDAGVADIGIGTTDSPVSDAASTGDVTYDASGGLFDANIPDITFENGTTAQECYDCTISQCGSQVAACNTDAKCQGLALCVLDTCGGSTTNFTCLEGCLTSSGVSATDPAVTDAYAVATCTESKCAASCPSAGGTAAIRAPSSDEVPASIASLVRIAASFQDIPDARRAMIDRLSRAR